MPMAQTFNPDLVIVSAGFDATEGDPLGQMKVSPAGASAQRNAWDKCQHSIILQPACTATAALDSSD